MVTIRAQKRVAETDLVPCALDHPDAVRFEVYQGSRLLSIKYTRSDVKQFLATNGLDTEDKL